MTTSRVLGSGPSWTSSTCVISPGVLSTHSSGMCVPPVLEAESRIRPGGRSSMRKVPVAGSRATLLVWALRGPCRFQL